jgi:hypothetical protein
MLQRITSHFVFFVCLFTVPATAQELIRRSMPNLNNQSRMRLPQPSSLVGNLNRQHGSDSGLRPPSMSGAVRPPVHNGSAFGLMRPQFKVPQPPPPVETDLKTTRGTVTTTEPVRSSQMVRDTN